MTSIFLFRQDVREEFKHLPDEGLDISHFNIKAGDVQATGIVVFVGDDYSKILKSRYSFLGRIVPEHEMV